MFIIGGAAGLVLLMGVSVGLGALTALVEELVIPLIKLSRGR